MELECGPSSDRRKLVLELPSYTGNLENPALINLQTRLNKQKGNFRIGILVSGGLDSALLYYLLHKENHQTGNKFTITPYTILRKEGSKYHALDVINYINGLFDMPKTKLNIVGDNSLEEIRQVLSGQKDVLKTEDFAYIGVIEARPEHSIGWVRYGFIEKARVRYPLLNLQKSHIVDLICQNNLQELFDLTHSCAIHETDPCGYCNGCMERQWGLDQMKIVDYR